MLRLRCSARFSSVCRRLCCGAAGLLILAATSPAGAQMIARPVIVVEGSGGGGGSTTVALPEDRSIARKLKAAKDQITAKDYGNAVSVLGKLLETSEDYFFRPDADSKSHYSLRKEIERLIGSLPEEGRRQYDLRFGPSGEKLLAEALASGSWQTLEDVTRRYFHTESGYQAAWLLADLYLDQGQPLVAAKTIERLQQAPPKTVAALEPALSIKLAACWLLAQREDRAKAVLDRLSKTRSGASLKFAEREIELFAPGGEPMARLRKHLPEILQRATSVTDHLLARGDATRSGAGASHIPQVQFAWSADHYHGGGPDALSGGNPLFGNDNETDIAKAIQGGVTMLRQQGQPVLPAAQPIVVGDLILLRTATQLVAIDCRPEREGNRRWHVARDERMFKLIDDAAREPAATAPPAVFDGRRRVPYNPGYNFAAMRDQALQQRALYDATYGSLSSDGERVFCVEDLNPVTFNYQAYLMGGMPMPQQGAATTYNRLRAYSIHKPEAKLMWELGGEKSAQTGAQNSPLAGAFFLGPPLPLSGRLYALVETNKQISLETIEQQKGTYSDGKLRVTPQPLWSQPLCNVEMGVESDFTRRTAGLTPAHSDGILVCPTAAGAVVAVDLTTRSLLWAYTFSRDEFVNSPYGTFPGGGIVVGPGGRTPYVGQGQGWADTGVIIAEGKVLATERGSRYLHCLNLEDGSSAWKEKLDRHDALFVGGVHDGHVLLVCPNYVRAHKMSDGAPAWPGSPRKEFPGGAKVAGRGFHHSGVYVLPLDNGRLATVEIKTGEMKVTDDKVLPEGRAGLGNLVCVNNWLISQDVSGVQGFHQVSLETLSDAVKKNPSDPKALTQLGELLRQKGDLDGAIGHLRRAAELSKTVVARRILARALVQALQSDFAKYRSLADELDPLTAAAETADLRAQYLRIHSDGLLAAHEYQPAFGRLLKLAQCDPRGMPLMPSGDALVRNDRWLQARWVKLLEGAPPEVRIEVEKAVAARLAAAQQDAAPHALRLALLYFGNHSAAEAGRQRLADLLLGQNDKQRLEVELLLRGLERSADPQRSAAAVAALAQFYRTAAEHPVQLHGFPAARHYYDLLKGDLAAVAGPNGKTGKQLFDEALAADEKFREFLKPKTWPTGRITVKASGAATGGADPFAPVRRVPSGTIGQPEIDTTFLADPLASQCRYQIRGGYFTALNLGGKPMWCVSLSEIKKGDEDVRVAAAYQTVAYGHRLAAHGHLLALVTGYEIIGIDASPGIEEDARLLWRHSLTRLTETDSGAYLTPAPRLEQTTWGQTVVRFHSPQGPLGSLEPVVSARQVSFLRGSELVTVEALTGDVLWKRSGLPLGSDLIGDEQHLLVIGPEETKATVYRALDGEQLGTRPAPHRTQRMANVGSRVLCWEPSEADGKVTLKMVDVLAEKTLWSSDLSSAAKAALAGPDEIGVLDARGAADRGRDPFQLISLADGKVRFSSLVTGPAADGATGIVLLRSADRYVLGVTNAAQAAARRALPARIAPTAYGNQGTAHIQGRLYVIDRRTGKLVKDWEAQGIGLPLSQPPESPVVAFVTTAYGARTTGLTRSPNTYQTVVQFLDKRTGRVVYRETFPPQMNGTADVSLTVGPGNKVEFQHQSINLVLNFFDEAPTEEEQEKAKGLDLSLGLVGGNVVTPGIPIEGPIRRGIVVPLPVPVPVVPVPVEPAPAPAIPRPR